jgi:transcriptional antiterminator NusG
MSGKEEKIKSSIFRELEYEPDIAKNIEDILIPTENVVHIKNGKKLVKKKVFFPGYILLKKTMKIQKRTFTRHVKPKLSKMIRKKVKSQKRRLTRQVEPNL